MFKKNVALVLMLLCLFAALPAAAQEATVETFPIPGVALYSELSPDGRLLATYNNSVILSDEVDPLLLPIRLYDVETGELFAELTGHADYPAAAAFSLDNARFFTYHPTGYVHIWSLPDGEYLGAMNVIPFGSAMEYLAGDGLVILQSAQIITQIWDVESGAMTHVLLNRFDTMAELRASMNDSIPDIGAALAASPDGNQVAVATGYGNLWLWDIEAQESTLLVTSAYENPVFPIRALQFTSDGERLVYIETQQDLLNVLDLASGDLTEIPAPDTSFRVLAVSPDGSRAAWLSDAGEDRAIVVSALDGSGDEQRIPLPIDEDIMVERASASLHFTPDGSRLVFTGMMTHDYDNAFFVIDLG